MENRAAPNNKTFLNRLGRIGSILHTGTRRTQTVKKRRTNSKIKGKHLHELYKHSRRY
jgi:hypothetical protein